MQTLKIPYYASNENLELIKEYQKQYSACLHYMYNKVKEGYSETEIKHLQINNIDLIDAWFKQSCVKDAISLYKSFQKRYEEHEENRKENLEKLNIKYCNGKCSKKYYNRRKTFILKPLKMIFGGKKNFNDRIDGKISNDEFKNNRLLGIYSIGTRSNKGIAGNQKFHIESDLSIVFKANKHTQIHLQLQYHNKQLIKTLYLNQETRKFSLTYKLDQKFVYISFDENELDTNMQYEQIQNRVLGIDLNPNYVGWSIVDWKSESEFKVIKSGVYSIKALNAKDFDLKDKGYRTESKERVYITNKRRFETIQIVKNLVNKAIYYKCQLISIEDLNIKSSDKELGKHFNKLVNNSWNRNLFTNNIQKRCNIFRIKLLKVKPEYSSFIGNFLYRSLNLPDMCLASIELGRRAYEFYNQYISKTKEIKKNIIQPDLKLFNDLIIKSLEEFNIQREQFKDLIELYSLFKKSKRKYRLSIDQFNLQFSRKFLKYIYINKYIFI